MTRETLEELRRRTAFKPKPPDGELAIAHVRVEQLGIPHAIDDRLLNGMTTDDEAFTIIVGPPGSGKSSLLMATALTATTRHATPVALPLKVPVAHRAEAITAELLVSAIAQSLAYELRGQLTTTQREQLERALATTISVGHQAGGLSAALTAGPPLLQGTLGATLGRELVTLTTRTEWRGGGPIPALLALRDLTDAHHIRLVVMFDDADIWSAADAHMATHARAFFSALRVLLDCPEVSILVTVQTSWTQPDATTAAAATQAARREYRELAERAGAVLHVPLPRSRTQARALITAVINRRVEIVLPDNPAPASGWSDALFTAAAIDLLANRCLTKSIRIAIADIRDTFDHLREMPDQIDADHLLEVIDT